MSNTDQLVQEPTDLRSRDRARRVELGVGTALDEARTALDAAGQAYEQEPSESNRQSLELAAKRLESVKPRRLKPDVQNAMTSAAEIASKIRSDQFLQREFTPARTMAERIKSA
jgi:hypothetical protein